MNWTTADLTSLATATAAVAGVLVLEHFAVLAGARLLGHKQGNDGRTTILPARWNYAIGLVTVAGGILAWAAWRNIRLDVWGAALLLGAMCVAGAPNFVVHALEEARARRLRQAEEQAQRQELERLRDLAATWPEIAGELARWRVAGNRRHYTAALDLLEGLQFNMTEVRQIARILELRSEQLGGVIDEILPERRGKEA